MAQAPCASAVPPEPASGTNKASPPPQLTPSVFRTGSAPALLDAATVAKARLEVPLQSFAPVVDWPLPVVDGETDITDDLESVPPDAQVPATNCDMGKWIANTPFFRRVHLEPKRKKRGEDGEGKHTHNIQIRVADGEVRPAGISRRGMRMKQELEERLMRRIYGDDWPKTHSNVFLCNEFEAKKMSQKVKNRWFVCIGIDCWAAVFKSQIRRGLIRASRKAQDALQDAENASTWSDKEDGQPQQPPPAKRPRLQSTTKKYIAVAYIIKRHGSNRVTLIADPTVLFGLLYRSPEADQYMKAQDDWLTIFKRSSEVSVEAFLAQYKISGSSSSEAPQLSEAWKHVVAPRGIIMRDMWCKLCACVDKKNASKIRKTDVRLVREWGVADEDENAENASRVLAGIRHNTRGTASSVVFDPASERLNANALSFDAFFAEPPMPSTPPPRSSPQPQKNG